MVFSVEMMLEKSISIRETKKKNFLKYDVKMYMVISPYYMSVLLISSPLA